MAQLESFGTFDKISEIHSLSKTAKSCTAENEEAELVDWEALENASENLMQHLSMDHLDMLHHRYNMDKYWT